LERISECIYRTMTFLGKYRQRRKIVDFTTITALIAVASTAVGVATNAFGVLDKVISVGERVGHWFRRGAGPAVPTKTVIAIVDPRSNALFWGFASSGTVPGMQVVADFKVTNISSEPVSLLVGVLRYRRRWWNATRKHVRAAPMVRDLRSQYSGQYEIPSRATTGVRINFIYGERERPSPMDFIADVALVDQFGNHHWLNGLRFKHPNTIHF